MINPTATTCIAISFEIPKREQARGMSSREPPATPDAPQAASAATMLRISAEGKSTDTPTVLAAASVMIVMVIAAPSMLMVAPRGMDTE